MVGCAADSGESAAVGVSAVRVWTWRDRVLESSGSCLFRHFLPFARQLSWANGQSCSKSPCSEKTSSNMVQTALQQSVPDHYVFCVLFTVRNGRVILPADGLPVVQFLHSLQPHVCHNTARLN